MLTGKRRSTDTPSIVRSSPATLARAARLVRAGKLVAFPTETVYGLGGDATSDEAVAGIYEAKARPRFNPLIVHIKDMRAAEPLVHLDARARALARAFWPGPLTLVLHRRENSPVSWLASAGLDTLAIRIPDHPVARALLRAARRPLAAPSANRSGRISPTSAADVATSFRGAKLKQFVPIILDGGRCRVGLESTVLDLSGPRPVLLRPGGITQDAIERVIGPIYKPGKRDAIKAPGQLKSHYAPLRPIRLNAARPQAGEAYLGFGKLPPGVNGANVLNLSPSRDLTEAAANLFAMLRALDRGPVRRIAVAPIPSRALGIAINDRLSRAAAPRG